mmetsp:Transcript_95058/g.271821  ORF Transcript_95058/g.271821 Transcript_95058/m.271821 type:complete len:271 (-) Transcript_95058:301-1113(-)
MRRSILVRNTVEERQHIVCLSIDMQQLEVYPGLPVYLPPLGLVRDLSLVPPKLIHWYSFVPPVDDLLANEELRCNRRCLRDDGVSARSTYCMGHRFSCVCLFLHQRSLRSSLGFLLFSSLIWLAHIALWHEPMCPDCTFTGGPVHVRVDERHHVPRLLLQTRIGKLRFGPGFVHRRIDEGFHPFVQSFGDGCRCGNGRRWCCGRKLHSTIHQRAICRRIESSPDCLLQVGLITHRPDPSGLQPCLQFLNCFVCVNDRFGISLCLGLRVSS